VITGPAHAAARPNASASGGLGQDRTSSVRGSAEMPEGVAATTTSTAPVTVTTVARI
jgi:hypothetical protein